MRRFIKILAILFLAFALPLIGYLWHYHHITAEIMKQHQLDGEQGNAFKHTYAAAQLYSALTRILPPDAAENTVVWLGHMNEHAEQWLRAYPKNRAPGRQPDTTIEIIKDLNNNRVGIAAARWMKLHSHKETATLDLVLHLIKTDIVIVWAPTTKISQHELDAHLNDVAFAIAWVERQHEDITERTEKALARMY